MEYFELVLKVIERVNGMGIIAQTMVLILLIIAALKIPQIKSIVRGNGYCADHKQQIEQMIKNTSAVNNLIERADKHHEEQREDMKSIRTDLSTQAKIITEHDIKIDALHSAFKDRNW